MIWCIDRISKTSSTSKQQKKKKQQESEKEKKTNKERKKIVEFIRLDTTMYLMGFSLIERTSSLRYIKRR